MLVISFNGYAQTEFQKGYYLTNEGTRIECLIKNKKWLDNPQDFEYKKNSKSKPTIKGLDDVQEFAITGIRKFVKFQVKINLTSDRLHSMSHQKAPEFEDALLFLEEIVDGKAKLYFYRKGHAKRYFYTEESSNIEQLIYKKYRIKIPGYANKDVATNRDYRIQLWNNLKCNTIKMERLENVDYKRNDLVKFFIEYNKCHNSSYTTTTVEKEKVFKLSIRGGIKNNSLLVKHRNIAQRNTQFDDQIGFRFGVESEFILPYNRNKWSITLEPTFNYFKSEKEITYSNFLMGNKTIVNVDYKSIDVPIGVRYYLFFNNNSKMSLSASYVFSKPLQSYLYADKRNIIDIEFNNNRNFLFGNNYALGIAFHYLNRYSLELRWDESRNFLNTYYFWATRYNSLSINFGFRLW